MKKIQKSTSGSVLLILLGTYFLLSFSYARNDYKLLVSSEILINSNVNEKVNSVDRENSLPNSFDCPGGTEPTASIFAIQSTCTNNVANSDGYLQLSAITNGDRVNFSIGSSYTGDADYTNATTIGMLPFQFGTGLANPSGSQDYTVRIFNGASACFLDVVVRLNEQDCAIGCACNEFIYLNDPANGNIHKYNVETGDTTFLEIGNPIWYDGNELPAPHGLGTDLNGFLYIGEDAIASNIRRFTCDGELSPITEFAIPTNGQFNITSVGNTLYYNSGDWRDEDIEAIDLCTKDNISSLNFCGDVSPWADWGFTYNETTGLFYSTYKRATVANGVNGIYVYSADDFDNDPNTCISPMTLTPPLPTDEILEGITTDNDGNMYIVVKADANSCSYVLKYNAAGAYVTESPKDCLDNGSGYFNSIGIVYSESANMLFTSSQSPLEDCVYAFSTDLVPLKPMAGPSGVSNGAKGIAILKECCPTNNNVVIDTLLCSSSINEVIFLQELINCDGIICEGFWEEALGNSGLTYNSCNNSVTVNAAGACGSFTLGSNGIGNNPQCGAFTITVNVEVGEMIAPVIAGDQMVCEGEASTAFTIGTPASGSNTIDYQWQSSTTDCTTGFTNITSATSETYDPGIITETTYYRVVASTEGNCASGMCTDTSNCVTVTYSLYPTLADLVNESICEGDTFESSKVTTSVTNAVSVNYQWYDNNGTDNTGINMINGQTTATLTALPTTEGSYSYRVEAVNNSNNNCTVSEIVNLTILAKPTATAITINATCSGASSNNDGQIMISGFNTGERYALEENSSYTGSATFATGSTVIPADGVIANNLTNPSGVAQYTVRVFNSDECYIDRIVDLNEWTCTCLDPIAAPSPAVVCVSSMDTIYGKPTGGTGIYTIHSWTDLNTGTAAGYSLDLLNNENMTLDATAATEGTINLQYYVEDNVGCSVVVDHTIMLTLADAISICDDASNYAEIVAQPGLTNVVWFNSADTQVGTGDTLVVDANTLGMGDGMDSYYYNAEDATGCDAGLCCPVIVTAIDCCKPEICLPFRMTVKRGIRE